MKLLKISNIIWSLILLIILFLSVFYAFISTDAPYYIAIARDISNGNIPYKDIYNTYTPVMMYLNSLIYDIFNNPVYHVYLIFQYIVIGVSVVLFYIICQKLKIDKVRSYFLSLFLFIVILSSDGTYINLEVYVILFVFLAFLLLLNKSFFWCGALLSLGFFSKQYGIFNFLPFLLLVLTFHQFQRNYLRQFILGASTPLFLFVGYYIIIENIPFGYLFMQLSGQGYDQEMIDLKPSLFGVLAGAKVFILLLVPVIFLKINPLKDRIDGILVLGILVNLIPLFIQNFAHYFILTFPFVFILMARQHQRFNLKFIVVANISLVIISGVLFLRIIRYKDVYDKQLDTAHKYEKEYPTGSDVFLYKGYRFLYILNDYKNPVLKDVGYRYGFKPDEEFQSKFNVLMKE